METAEPIQTMVAGQANKFVRKIRHYLSIRDAPQEMLSAMNFEFAREIEGAICDALGIAPKRIHPWKTGGQLKTEPRKKVVRRKAK